MLDTAPPGHRARPRRADEPPADAGRTSGARPAATRTAIADAAQRLSAGATPAPSALPAFAAAPASLRPTADLRSAMPHYAEQRQAQPRPAQAEHAAPAGRRAAPEPPDPGLPLPTSGAEPADPATRLLATQVRALAPAEPSQVAAAPLPPGAATPATAPVAAGAPAGPARADRAGAPAEGAAGAAPTAEAEGAAGPRPAPAGASTRATATVEQVEAVDGTDDGETGEPGADTDGAPAEPAAAGAAEPAIESPSLERARAPAAEWTAAPQLATDRLPLPARPPPAPGSTAPAGPSPEQEAQDTARRAYAGVADEARRGQSELQQLAQRSLDDMASSWSVADGASRGHHERARSDLDAERERALARIDASAEQARRALDDAFLATLAAAEHAGSSAQGLITRNHRSADAQINTILGALVAEHVRVFGDAIAGIGRAADAANQAIDAWADNRATEYPTNVGGLLSAHREERQRRIPGVARQEKAALAERRGNTVAAFGRSQAQSTGSIQCGYRCPLDQHKQAMNREGRAAVRRTLAAAVHTLRRQTAQGRRALAATRAGARAQVEAIARAARSRIAAEARGSLQAQRGEAAAAQQGLRGAAQATLPALPRTAQRLEDTLRQAAERGPQALGNAARQAGPDLRQQVAQMRQQTGERLPAAAERLGQGLAGRASQLATRLVQAGSQNALALDGAVASSVGALRRTGEGFTEGFDQVAAQIARSADAWAEPLGRHFARMITKAQRDVAAQLTSLRTGVPVPAAGAAEAAPPARPGAPAPAPCPQCPTEAAAGGAAAPAARAGAVAGGAPAEPEAPQGLDAQRAAEEDFFGERARALAFFEQRYLVAVDAQVESQLTTKVGDVEGGLEAGIFDKVDEGRVTGALRGLSVFGGNGVVEIWSRRRHATDLRTALRIGLDPFGVGTHDYQAAIAYLAGRTAEGAAHELQASLGIFNDDEARIERTLGALTPAELRQLGAEHGAALAEVRDALDGADVRVFDALRQGDYAQAGALRLRDRVDEARRGGEQDATHSALEAAGQGPAYAGWQRQMEAQDEAAAARGELPANDDPTRRHADEARRAVMEQLGRMVSDADVAQAAGPGGVQSMSAIDRAAAYVTRPVEVPVNYGDGPPQTITLRLEGASRDLADALVRSGPQSAEARAARFGVELQRPDGPRPLQVDRATFDERFGEISPNLQGRARREAIERLSAARHEREEAIRIAATRYGGADPTASAGVLRSTLIGQFRNRLGDDRLGGDLVAGLITDERPSPVTVAMAMRHGMYAHWGTNEELLFHFTERMNRDEIAQMRQAFRDQTGRSLDAELGVYGEGGWFTELSGDDRLRMERALQGVPRTDRERLEVAAFAIQQQRRETGIVGRLLAADSYADQALTATERRLMGSVGGDAQFDRRGNLVAGGRVFDTDGNYTGKARTDFNVSANTAQQVAQNYSARIDAYANAVSMGIAILGAVAAAVASVLTAGAASPLLMAAIAGITGLTAMAANAAIKGGRYGYEQALVDLGMTAVQALTAGVGQSLALASRGGVAAMNQGLRQGLRLSTIGRAVDPRMLGQMGRLTGSMLGDQLAIGAITGGIGGMGNTALQEQTWERGILSGLGEVVYGGVKGAGSAAAGALVMNRLEALPVSRGAFAAMRSGGEYRSIGSEMGRLSAAGGAGAVALRSLGKGLLSAGAGMTTRGVDIGLDALTGRFHGDAGDALVAVGETGAHSLVQGLGEGAGEAAGQRRFDVRHPEQAAHREQERRQQVGEEQAARRARGTATAEPARTGPATPEPAGPRALQAPEPATAPRPAARAPEPETPAARAARAPEPEPAAPPPTRPVEADAAPRNLGPEEPESAATSPARVVGAGEADATPAAARAARPVAAEGAAAAVEDSDFHGAAARPGTPEAARLRTVKGALRRLVDLADSEVAGVRLPNRRDPTRLVLATLGGGEVTVRVRVARSPLPADADGSVPVARYRFDRERGEYIVEVSPGASARHVERALAHELAEIRAVHGSDGARRDDARPDALRPDGPAPERDAQGRPRLSPHDEGRLAELGVIAHQLQTARTAAGRARLMADAERLAAHLGLGGATGHADARRQAAFDALAARPQSQALLAEVLPLLAPRVARAAEVAERQRIAGPEAELQDLPREMAGGRRPGESAAVGDRSQVNARVQGALREQARRAFGRMLQEALLDEGRHNALTQLTLSHLDPAQVEFVVRTGRLPRDVEFHHFLSVADFPEFAHLAEAGAGLPRNVHREEAHGGKTGAPLEAATLRDPGATERLPLHETPEAQPRYRARRAEIAEGSRSTGDIDRDIQIAQRGLLRQMDADAQRLEQRAQRLQQVLDDVRANGGSARSIERLEQRIANQGRDAAAMRGRMAAIEAALPGLAQAAAARPVADDGGLASGTAAAVRGSRFRGDAEATPRPHPALMDEAEAAVARLTAAGGTIAEAQGVRQADGSILVTMRPTGGEGPELRVRIVPADVLTPEADGVPVARFDPAPDASADYVVRLSARSSAGTAHRALAHELTEIRHAHAAGPARAAEDNALRPGGYGAAGQARQRARLSPHDRGRLAEVEVLAHEHAQALLAGDHARAARVCDEAQHLMAHLGLADDTAPALARRSVADQALADRPEPVRQFLAQQAEAAQEHPFLRLWPPDRLGRMEMLIDRLALARQLGDSTLEAQVFRQAQGLIRFTGSGNVDVVGDGEFRSRGMDWLRRSADAAGHPRAAMLYELAQFVRAHRADQGSLRFGRRPPDPAEHDPQLVDAVRRRFADMRGAQTWEQFRQARLGRRPGADAPALEELNQAFFEWASGKIVAGSGKLASLVAGRRAPDVVCEIGEPQAVAAARLAPDTEVSPGPDGRSRRAQDALDQRRAAMAEAQALRQRRAGTADPDELNAIRRRLDELVPLINGPTEALGEAAALQVARVRFGVPDEQVQVARGSGQADVMFETTGPERIVLLEAKGGDAAPGSRLSRDRMRLVQQGTYEYAESLAAEWQRPGNPPGLRARGARLARALETGTPPVEYHLVRQPVSDDNTQLLDPTISTFTLRRPS